jgi:ADP-dependent NAD(P)H-hydrate dehydratase / NAD(P)H-hydrate epimerase
LHTGAARLAAMAAARIGAGVVALVGTKDALRDHAAHVTSIMLKTFIEVEPEKYRAACLGPAHGGGEHTRNAVLGLLKHHYALVLDADALTAFETVPQTLFDAVKSRPQTSVVITPHEGEFTRLFKPIAMTSQSKVEKAIAAAKLSGTVVLYKGPDTTIAHPDGRSHVNSNGTPKLATAGSGDVLAGLVTGLMAQGVEAYDAACTAAWHHADAARRSPFRAPLAEDIIAALP